MIALIAFIGAHASALFGGQIQYTVGVNADITTGGNTPNVPGSNLTQYDGSMVAFIGTYPSISLKARGEHSSLDSTYGFGYDGNFSNPIYETTSHHANLAYSSQLGPRLHLNISDQFSMTSNYSTFKLLSGATPVDPEEFQFLFTPVFLQSNRSNNATVGLDRTLSKRSSLTVTGSYSTLDYPANPATTNILTDQKRISATIAYRRSGEHYSWSIGYAGARFNFVAFENALSHSGFIQYTHQFSPTMSFSVDVGPSYLDSLEGVESPVGTNVTLGLRRSEEKRSFSVSLSQTGGDTSGLGAVSRTRSATFDVAQRIGRSTNFSVSVSGFDSKGLQANALSARGFSAGGSIGYLLARYWSLNGGAQYQRYEGYNTGGYDELRLFVSLRFSDPELWRF